MKKPNPKKRKRIRNKNIRYRKKHNVSNNKVKKQRKNKLLNINKYIKNKIEKAVRKGVEIIIKNKNLTVILPKTMNLYSNYKLTIEYINLIRDISTNSSSNRFYQIKKVDFSRLKEISSPAALLLTSELSRWNIFAHNNISAEARNWDPIIFNRFKELGFFNLFPNVNLSPSKNVEENNVYFVKYIKGGIGSSCYKSLREQLQNVIGEKIEKWPRLHGGLDEAITNVFHHAYPDRKKFPEKIKNWYLTGAYNKKTRNLKIVFCDHGIGIPQSLPTSKLWEKILASIQIFPIAEKRKHSTLLKAAMEVKRTSTNKSDRGKGLPDMKEFIKSRGNGYLAIMSGQGLYKLNVTNGTEKHKSDTLVPGIKGTLIIWKIQL